MYTVFNTSVPLLRLIPNIAVKTVIYHILSLHSFVDPGFLTFRLDHRVSPKYTSYNDIGSHGMTLSERTITILV